jgi:hypothetical protein
MIIDHLLEFTPAEGTKLTGAADAPTTLDFLQEHPTTGYAATRLHAVFAISADVTGELLISLQDSDEAESGFKDCAVAASVTDPKEGTLIAIPLPTRHKRYLKAHFGGSPTAGTVKGFVTSGVQDFFAYPMNK